jgi:glycosyltransferase involved in cell wall biosynthesis
MVERELGLAASAEFVADILFRAALKGDSVDGLPPVSCMCLTYGRPALLEESIESFIRQEYGGERELIVLNDCAEQRLEMRWSAPQIKIINVAQRFRTVGEKRNACAALASHDVLFVWDDDDIYLPHRLFYSVRMLDPRKRFFKPSKAFTLNNGVVAGPRANLFHSGACFLRSLFDEVRGYSHMGSGQDMDIEQRMQAIIGKGKNFNAIRPEDIYYLYRWGGSGSYHLSAYGRDRDGAQTGQDLVSIAVAGQLAAGTIPAGRVLLNPTWRADYSALVRDLLYATTPPVSH